MSGGWWTSSGAARESVARCERLVAEARSDTKPVGDDRAVHLALATERAHLALIESTEAFADAQESLGVLLNESSANVSRLEPRGGLRDVFPPPPAADDLVRLAIDGRADLVAIRRGIGRAQAEVDLQRASAVDDLYLFYDPITVQDLSPFNRSSASSWALGLTYSMPIFDRNQGNIARARTNVCQTRRELDAAIRRVESEVRLADREYRTSRQALERIEGGLMPTAAASLRRHLDAFSRGEIGADTLSEQFEDAASIAQSHRDALVRHRKSMIELNAAVGLRILP